jgi:glycosyltransferase involved in cell wall biosynthesis
MARLRGLIVGRIIDRIAPVSNANALRAVTDVFLPAQKVRVIHNGIALDRFPFPPRTKKRSIRIVYVGQLIPEKGICTLLEAYRLLKEAHSAKVDLLIAGEGHQDRELREFCALHGLDDVRFAGHINWVADLFSDADIVVVPSIWAEAFGLVAAEAMACGAATVVSDAGALPEVVGDAGLVFRSGDANDLAARLLQLIESPELRARLGRRGRARVEEHFTLERSLRERIDLCEEVFNERSIGARSACEFSQDEPTHVEFQRALEQGAGDKVTAELHAETAA